jgi:hypothetical protein
MATLAITIPKGSQTGAIIRRWALQLEKMANDIPDNVPTGADTVVTVDNAPAAGNLSVQVTAGPYPSQLFVI